MKLTVRDAAIMVLATVVLSVSAMWGFLQFTGVFDAQETYLELSAVDAQNTQNLYTDLQQVQDSRLRNMDAQMILFATAQEYEVLRGQKPEDVQANEDGLYPVLINRIAVPAFLTEGKILVRGDVLQSQVFSANSGDVPQELYDRVFLVFTLLPAQGVEENWEQEEVFSGSMNELTNSGRVALDSDTRVLVVTRPDNRLVADPSDALPSLDAEEIKPGETVYFIRSFGGTMVFATSTISRVLKNANGTFILVEVVDGGLDYPTPIFVEREGTLVWIGNMVDGIPGLGIVVSAKRMNQVVNLVAAE